MIAQEEKTSLPVLQHGWLQKRSRHLHKWRTRYAVLTPHALYTFKSNHTASIDENENGESSLTITKHLKNDTTESIDLNRYSYIEDFSWKYNVFMLHPELWPKSMVENSDIDFYLKSSNPKGHIFEFQSSCQQEKNVWCSHICQALGKPDPMLKIKLKQEMSEIAKNSTTKNDKALRSPQQTTLTLVRTFVNVRVEMEADRIPQEVLQLITDYLFHRVQCCFLSKREPISTLDLMFDKERLNKYILEYSKFRGINSKWFDDSLFDMDKMNSDLNEQRYPFEITTMTADNKLFDNQLLKAKDCTFHNNFKPFDLEYLGSFANVKLHSGVIRKIVKSEKVQSQRIRNSLKKWSKEAKVSEPENAEAVDVDITDWMSRYKTEELSQKKFQLLITKRKQSDDHVGGYWLHFLDYEALFVDKDRSFLEENGYCMQLPTPLQCIAKEAEYNKRQCSLTYNVEKKTVLLVCESVNDIFEYNMILSDMFSSFGESSRIGRHAAALCWSKLGLTDSWDAIKRDAASLCWLTSDKLMIIGGHNQFSAGSYSVGSDVHLLDVTANVIIPLRHMRKARHNAASLYLQYSNEVVVGSGETVEFYDPAKDYWTLYPHETNERYWDACFIWTDLENPNVLYMGESREREKSDQGHVEWIDRRENCEWKFLDTPKNVSYFGQFYVDPNKN